MPRIFDNIEQQLLPALRETLQGATRADFCVGYFHLRGWDSIADLVEGFAGSDDSCCRVLVGMQRPPQDAMRQLQSALRLEQRLDGPTVARLRRERTERFKKQIEFGLPSAAAETTLRRLARHLRARQARVKVFLAYPLHAKLYLILRSDPITPLIGYLGSSNLTLAGLSRQGELNVDIVEQDAARKLQQWFNERWEDRLAFDISDRLAELIETSWVRETLPLPYHVYLKMAYYLSQEAHQGEREFELPKVFEGVLLDFQTKAVSLAAHHLHRRGGVLLADVVGLGKTLMATAVAKIMQEDDEGNTLVICPPKLRDMWQWHVDEYELTARVVSLGNVIRELPNVRGRRRLVIIDESHNLRNRKGKRYQAIHDYILDQESRVVLLSATPYNKQFTDLSNQLRLIISDGEDLHVRPERFFQQWREDGYNEADFVARFQASPRSLRAFDQSPFPEDWRDLMRLYMVRRPRDFIIANYAHFDQERQRHYVMLGQERFHFPVCRPKTLQFDFDEKDPQDQYARLFRESVVKVINGLALPRYGLANYLVAGAEKRARGEQKEILDNLNRAGGRLIGFCRTNLFKRLESSGSSFLLSIDRHILRNLATWHALEHGLPVPVGTQSAAMLDTAISDADEDWADIESSDEADDGWALDQVPGGRPVDLDAYRARAARVHQSYREQFVQRFQWLDADFFTRALARDLLADAQGLLGVLQDAGRWDPSADAKLDLLYDLLSRKHPSDKVLVFTQFADTALYLNQQLQARGLDALEVATGGSRDPTALARRFSPSTNGGLRQGESELRVLIATDVLAEGQNLQDGHIVVNYDLPWAIIRLVQRRGRVDRIGQKHDTILAYSFFSADGVEDIIHLRRRLFARLQENQEVIGSDESFFGEDAANNLRDLYTEESDVYDREQDTKDVDLTSQALSIWNSASEEDRKTAQALPPLVLSARAHRPTPAQPPGVITYLRFPDGTDALVRVDDDGELVSQSLSATFAAAACAPDTPLLPRGEHHHELVARSVRLATQEQVAMGGQLGTLRSTRRQVYERLKLYRQAVQGQMPLLAPQFLQELEPAFSTLYRYLLRRRARTSLRRQMQLGISDQSLAQMVIRLHEEERLCNVTEEVQQAEPQIVCSLGLRAVNQDQPT